MRLIYVIVTVAFLDTFSQLPIIAPFSISLGATPIQVGIIIGMYSLSNIGGNILSGIWIDRIGPKKVLAAGMLLVALVLFFYSFVSTPNQLIFVRFFHGLTGGLIVPAAFTFLGSKDRKREKGKTMAFSGAAVGIAAIIGPAMGALIFAKVGADWLFYLLSLLMFLFGLLAFYLLTEQQRQIEDSNLIKEEQHAAVSLWSPMLIRTYWSIFLLMFAQGTLVYTLPLKISELSLGPEMTGVLLSIFGVTAIAFFVLPTNKIFDRKDKQTLMSLGVLIISFALGILSVSYSVHSLILAMVIYGVGFALIFPSASGALAENVEEKKRGRAFGIFYAFFSIGVIAGSFLAGFLAMDASNLFAISAFILFICIIIIFSSKVLQQNR